MTLIGVAGLPSALFLNDTVVSMLTPLVVALARRLQVRPLPYPLALAMAANAGGVATLAGNPEYVVVGLAAQLSFARFASVLAAAPPIPLRPVAGLAGGTPHAALILAMAATLASDLTLVVTIANLIVVESARRLSADVSFLSLRACGNPRHARDARVGCAVAAVAVKAHPDSRRMRSGPSAAGLPIVFDTGYACSASSS